jgi:hypothetical protein
MMMSAAVFGTAESLGGQYRRRFEPSRNTQQPPPPPFDACERGRGWVVEERNRMDDGDSEFNKSRLKRRILSIGLLEEVTVMMIGDC